jgi:hypothetical protein
MRHLYKDIESYHKGTQKEYYEKIPGIYDFIKDRAIFYATEPLYKNVSRTESIVKLIRQDRGME